MESGRFGDFVRVIKMLNNGRRRALIIPLGFEGRGWQDDPVDNGA